MNNEFAGTGGWQCPCSVQPGGCDPPDCTVTGDDVLETYDMFQRNKCVNKEDRLWCSTALETLASLSTLLELRRCM